jgi:trigger factor
LSSANPQENPAENLEGQPSATGAEIISDSPGLLKPGEEEIPENSACLREVAVEIPAEVVNKEFDSMLLRYTKVARIPGFRKGKVPVSIVRTRFADEIRTEVLESLVPRYFREAVMKEGFKPIAAPHIHSLINEPGQPVQFKAAFEIMPEVPLGNYKDMTLEVPEVKVTDEDVEAELKRLQERYATYDPVEDRPIEEGDFAQISFNAVPAEGSHEAPPQPEGETAGPAPAPPVKVNEVLVEIGAANTMPEFSQNLRGARPGEERTFQVTYPADYHEKQMAGRTFSYTAKVNAIKKKTVPGLTDDFAKELSQDCQTLDELKKRLREGMLADREYQTQQEAREMLLKQLADTHDFPVPETMIQKQIDFRLEQWLRALAAQGVRTEDMKRLDFKRLRASQRPAAAREVKAQLVLEKVAEAENIQATEDEVNRHIHALAKQAKETPEALQHRLEDSGGLERIRRRIRSDKALHFLYDKSTANTRNGAHQE